jgi:hypothetical protein
MAADVSQHRWLALPSLVTGLVSLLPLALLLFAFAAFWPGLITWALIVFLLAGRPSAPPLDDVMALDGKRRALGWFAYGLLALILLPLPHALSSTLGLHCPYV